MRLRGTNRNFRRVSPRVPFNPRKLFRNSEQGVHYDPSDFSTLFQDSAGTTPVTAVEQPVGLMLDKRLGLVLGSELVINGTFSNGETGWTRASSLPSDWSVSAGRMVFTADGTNRARARQSLTVLPGKLYELTCDLTSSSLQIGTAIGGTNVVNLPETIGAVRLRFFASQPELYLQLSSVFNGVSYSDNISVKELPGNHAFQTTAIDRPILRQDANGNFYLAANGTNTWMQTNSIDFTGTDKVTVFAGVRKLSDSAIGMFTELSTSGTTNAGSFSLIAPPAASATYGGRSRGSVDNTVLTSSSYPSPISSVVTLSGYIASDLLTLRVSGVLAASSVSDQGTGNYGNYPLYLFRRAGTSLPFNGQFYGLLIRGALTSDPDTLKMEKWLSFKTGVQL